ncbi:hypothetical protein V492_01977 [Pseudogymnoascus sp. VKM F-4246]|nr:hypothetical protein V492_01977 [Pseudogymnoascus sp. VKM F-4246]
MEKIKSILSPGKQVEDEILYGSGRGGQYEHTGREAPGSTGGYYGGTGGESQIYDRERDSIPSQPSSVQEYGKTEEEYARAEKERAAKTKVAREQSAAEKEKFYRAGDEKAAREEKQARHKKSHSGEHKESRNPYTQQALDPRLGGAEESTAARNGQPPAYAAAAAPTDATRTADTARTTQGYEREDTAGHGGKGAAAAGLVGAAGAAGAAGVAGSSRQQGQVKAIPLETDSPHGEVVGRTVSGHHTVERTASGQYRTRLASIIDPNYGGGVNKPENAYEHTPGGGGAYEADEFHGRESRVASVTLPGGQKYTDPEADENYGLGYTSNRPSGVAYTTPAGSGYGEGSGRSMPGAYEHGDYGRQTQPQVATTKSEATRALSGDETGHRGVGTGAAVGAGVAGAAVADAGFEGTKADRAHPQSVEDPAYRTSRSHAPDDPVYKTHPTKTEETTTTTTTQKADKSAKKAASKAAPAQRADEAAYTKPPPAKYGDVDVPPGNDYGKGVKDPRYGLPMAAAGISAEEAAALRRNEANVARPSTADRDYAAQPTAASQQYATQPTTQAQQQAAKTTPTKEEKPSRRSSILGFLHLGKDKDKKRHSKEEKRLSDTQRQSYTDRTGTAAGVAPVPGSVTRHDEPTSDLAYRNRMPSTADAPAFTGGLVAPNGAPLKGASAANADSSAWAKSTERDIMDRGGMGQGASGAGGATNQAAYGGAGTTNQSAYGSGIDESYANEPSATGATQKSGSHGVATTGGAIAAGAAAGGLAAGGMRGSQAKEGVASDYNMQSAQDKGAPTNDALYDQVSPHSSAANKKAQETSHKTKETKTNHTKETKSNNHKSHGHKEKNSVAYAGSGDAQARDAAYGGYENDALVGNAAQGGYGSSPQATQATEATKAAKAGGYDTYGNGAESNSAAYGGKETQASDAAYGNGGYSGQGADETAFGDEAYVGGEGNGVTRHGTTKVAERAGHHVLHKDPPASHPAAAAAGLE